MKKAKLPDTKEILTRIETLSENVKKAQDPTNDNKNKWLRVRRAWSNLCEMFTEQPSQKIIVFKEKYGDIYYDASTKEQMWKSMYDVIKRRNDSDNYFYFRNIPKAPEMPMIALEDAEIYETPIKEAIIQSWSSYKSKIKEIDYMKSASKSLEKALQSGGKNSSVKEFLDFYDNGEYSDYVVHKLEKVD